ncbi:hypothetical protein [Streptomyces sp. CC228A]|uniref:hypothetical protein n=1 Tax=Streptomyces sp. CC228A TaxID=2898186 RepID=UPI001F29EDEB|nr:hypothetical protein [Streptomyces sp. CC228A]
MGKPEYGAEGGEETEKEEKRFDLTGSQVAASAVAAVLAATLASRLGVYGTVVGAGVISVIATCGGPLLQHLFSRTGEKVRGATTRTARPAGAPRPAAAPAARPPAGAGCGDPTTYATTYATGARGRRRSVLAAVLVFAVAMTGITAYELVSGQNLSGGKGATTFGAVVGGGRRRTVRGTAARAPAGSRSPTAHRTAPPRTGGPARAAVPHRPAPRTRRRGHRPAGIPAGRPAFLRAGSVRPRTVHAGTVRPRAVHAGTVRSRAVPVRVRGGTARHGTGVRRHRPGRTRRPGKRRGQESGPAD